MIHPLIQSILTLSKTTNFRLFRIERVCRQQFQVDENVAKFSKMVKNTVGKGEIADDNSEFDENGRKFAKQVENTEGKVEIARNQQFLLFPHCFQKTCIGDT